MCLSLTKEDYASKIKDIDPSRNVKMLNPLSSDLNVLRQTLLFSGLETIAYNQNRKNADLKLYEFGKTYMSIKGETVKYVETKHLSLFITGKKQEENWNAKNNSVDFYLLKGFVEGVLNRLGIAFKMTENNSAVFSQALAYTCNKKAAVEFGSVSKAVLKLMDIKQEVYYADFNWDVIIDALKKNAPVMFADVPKFPAVRRDLALLIDKTIKFEQLEQLALQSEKNILKSVNLFDVYEGDKLPQGKKSYALSFILQDEHATLTDKQIEKVMEKLMKTYQEKAGAEIR
jgi:phenylalanyl-tRNA synthetase beta chain